MFKSIKKNFLLIITLSFFLFPLLVNAQWSTLQDNGATRNPASAVGEAIAEGYNALKDAPGKYVMGKAIDTLVDVSAYLTAHILSFIGLGLQAIGWLLDGVIDKTVLNFATTYGALDGAVDSAWVLLRDVSNIIFIFLILFTAISIIVSGDLFGKKKTLASIIIVAIVLNFSMFFTKAAVDLSNYATVSIYKSIKLDGKIISEAAGDSANIGVQIMAALKLQTFIDPKNKHTQETLKEMANGNIMNLVTLTLYAFIFMGMAGITMLYVSAMLIWRFLAVIFLIIFSPLAFISTILPKGKAFFNVWLKELTTNLFFPPAFFLGLYLVLLFAQQSATKIAGNASFASMANLNFLERTEASVLGLIGLILNLFLVLAFLFIITWGSRKLGTSGGGLTSVVMSNSARYAERRMGRFAGGSVAGSAGYVGRNTAGRAGTRLANSRMFSGNGFVKRKLRGASEKVGNAGYDLRDTKGIQSLLKGNAGSGYNESIKERAANLKSGFDNAGKLSVTEDLAKAELSNKYSKETLGTLDKISKMDKELGKNEVQEKLKIKTAELDALRTKKQADPNNLSIDKDIEQASIEARELEELNNMGKGIEKIVRLQKSATAGTRRQEEFKKYTLGDGVVKKFVDKRVRDNNGQYKNKIAAAAGGTFNFFAPTATPAAKFTAKSKIDNANKEKSKKEELLKEMFTEKENAKNQIDPNQSV